jgi:hypothetical protein
MINNNRSYTVCSKVCCLKVYRIVSNHRTTIFYSLSYISFVIIMIGILILIVEIKVFVQFQNESFTCTIFA